LRKKSFGGKIIVMRERPSQVEYNEEQYRDSESLNSSTSKKRLDLNDLLKRVKNEEKNDKKFNLLIYSCAAFVIVVFSFIVSI